MRLEALLEAVDRVGEPDGTIAVDDDVIGRVEGAAAVVDHERRGFKVGLALVELGSRDRKNTAWLFSGSLSADQEAVAVVDATIG